MMLASLHAYRHWRDSMKKAFCGLAIVAMLMIFAVGAIAQSPGPLPPPNPKVTAIPSQTLSDCSCPLPPPNPKAAVIPSQILADYPGPLPPPNPKATDIPNPIMADGLPLPPPNPKLRNVNA